MKRVGIWKSCIIQLPVFSDEQYHYVSKLHMGKNLFEVQDKAVNFNRIEYMDFSDKISDSYCN